MSSREDDEVVVLVVDDSADDRRVVIRYLRRGEDHRYRVFEASSGKEALALAEEHTPDVFILDNHMGAMSGVELLEALREHGHGEAAFVILTGSTRDPEVFLELGTDDYVNKDELSERYFQRVVSNALIKARLRVQLAQRAAFEERLISIVAHDLRSPLQALIVGSELLQQEVGSPQLDRYLTTLKRSTKRMHRIVEQLLDLARVRQAGGFPLVLETLDLCELVQENVDELVEANPDRKIEVVCEGDGTGSFDSGAVAQIVTNLVSNALRHGDPECPVSVWGKADEGKVVLEIVNYGEPIPPAQREQLFRPFVRVGSKEREGLGLGLYIVGAIVKAHHGTVEVESSDNRTTFTVVLPKCRRES
ncbi:hybrid sensor histidine kinase/response regulator [Pseudenhygromyxa sp. WMMC2535]|uniref:hybrid sensor histidine kinase/response regulator n=1 Tax=Pseudenhygromyxa sp. WMMC2535 TaxID=2712867 RepID=UPI0015572951|nr:hybrid sensor histidine kinase/response regulator [Pseudenhygromyxa sp. WMMC2535]NVB43025.1 hybrid sensor histidine kinase/response regulator [Pseudenhygromyxa sp. WMMC2535]